jgi:hypothetical protein
VWRNLYQIVSHRVIPLDIFLRDFEINWLTTKLVQIATPFFFLPSPLNYNLARPWLTQPISQGTLDQVFGDPSKSTVHPFIVTVHLVHLVSLWSEPSRVFHFRIFPTSRALKFQVTVFLDELIYIVVLVSLKSRYVVPHLNQLYYYLWC